MPDLLDSLPSDPNLQDLLDRLNSIEPADRDPRNYHSCMAVFLARQGLLLSSQSSTTLVALSLLPSSLIEDVLAPGDVLKVTKALGQGAAGDLFVFVGEKFDEGQRARRLHLRGKIVVSPRERDERRSAWLNSTREARRVLLQELLTLALQSGPGSPLEWLWDLLEAKSL